MTDVRFFSKLASLSFPVPPSPLVVDAQRDMQAFYLHGYSMFSNG